MLTSKQRILYVYSFFSMERDSNKVWEENNRQPIGDSNFKLEDWVSLILNPKFKICFFILPKNKTGIYLKKIYIYIYINII